VGIGQWVVQRVTGTGEVLKNLEGEVMVRRRNKGGKMQSGKVQDNRGGRPSYEESGICLNQG